MSEQLRLTAVHCQTSGAFALHFRIAAKTSYAQAYIAGSTLHISILALPGENREEVSISLAILN